ncbi:hypothetical protein [Spongiivirga citrea]|uniref:PNPLA domain-containing protein n=1 Tax=Spongiivirga citrea TaxID=1481457 RepID=A0A6M0CL51_9FLAO|nr:hypothetical protein [Spongiivirga citrea]NER16589.1 hypothetical protein [Spongiivirga citrea]
MSADNQPTKKKKASTYKRVFKPRILWLLILTVLILIAASCCRIPGLIDHPQFTNKLDANFVIQLLTDNHMMWSYWAFFIIDFVWAFVLLRSIWIFVDDFVKNQTDYGKWIHSVLKVFKIIIVLAYVFDVCENVLYLWNYEYPKTIAGIKMGLYAVVLLGWLLVAIKKYYKRYFPSLLSFLKSAFYSLVIIVIIGVLLPKASQVNSIVVNLYMRPYNLGILLLVAAPIYAVMLAHYPSYFNIDKNRRKWYRANWSWQLISTVFYKNDYTKPEEKGTHAIEGHVNFLLRILGILFYAALFYFISFTSETNFHWPFATSVISSSMLLLGLCLLYYLRIKKQRWLKSNVTLLKSRIPFYDGDFNDADSDIDEVEEADLQQEAKRRLEKDLEKLASAEKSLTTEETENLRKIIPHIRIYGWIITVTVLITILFIGYLLFKYMTSDTELNNSLYTEGTAIVSLVCIVLQMVSFIYYRTFRSIFRLLFFSADSKLVVNAFYVMRVLKVDADEEVQLTQAHLDAKKGQLKEFYKHNPFGDPTGILKLLDRLNMGIFSNNIFFLQATAIFGMFNTAFFLLMNLVDELPFHFNAALIILSALFLYYGMLVVITKNFIFYRYSKEEYAVRNRQLFNFYLIIGLVVMLVFNVLTTKFPNNLFVLETVDRDKESELTLKEYTEALSPTKIKYYIGAYGGGMKSNAWTMTVLDELYKKDSTFLEKAVVMSGASGGTIGITNWSAIMKEDRDSLARTRMITDISTEHVLSMDLTHILGRDLVNYMFVPFFNKSGQDRSSKAMERYAKLAENQEAICSSTSYRAFWKEVYTENNNQFPILISNSTNVRGNQGMAVSIGGINSTNTYPSLLYQKADNILELEVYNDEAEKLEQKTISYYNAASTSNRFPLISPAAKIPTLGHFNDGGIYENSGLLSAYKLFRQINNQPGITDLDCLPETNVFISIVNDKNAYIKKTVQDYIKDGIRIKKINPNTELNAILNSVSSTEMMPIFIKTELERLDSLHQTIDFKTIYLPHQFNMQDIKDIYGLELISEKTNKPIYEHLYKCVTANNDSIKKWRFSTAANKRNPIIEAPMSRVMAPQAYEFMQKMVLDETPAGRMIKEISAIE